MNYAEFQARTFLLLCFNEIIDAKSQRWTSRWPSSQLINESSDEAALMLNNFIVMKFMSFYCNFDFPLSIAIFTAALFIRNFTISISIINLFQIKILKKLIN